MKVSPCRSGWHESSATGPGSADGSQGAASLGPALLPETIFLDLSRCPALSAPGGMRTGDSAPPWVPSAFTSCYRAFLRRRNLNLKVVKFHGLRHAYGSQLIQDGFDIKTVQSLMGHSRASTTLDVYSHLFDQPGEEVARRIQARIEKARTRKPNSGSAAAD
jgi:hypothetical protein